MGIRNIPKPVLICFASGFVLGALTLSTVYWMMAHGSLESEPAWAVLLCPASIGLMALPYDSHPAALADYIELVSIVAFANGIFFSGVGELIGFIQRKLLQPKGRIKV